MHLDDFLLKEKSVLVIVCAILGYVISIIVVLIAIFHTVAASNVVISVTVSIIGAPFLTLAALTIGNKSSDNNSNNPNQSGNKI
jgi:uncharacterized protein YacL